MLLQHSANWRTAEPVMAAIERVTANPALHTRDLGGNATTTDMTIAVCDALANVRDGVSS
jgi:tartrate dehydrogenase/decarboxylase/D-malate dehydrogenase